MIWTANQLTGFYMRATLALNGLKAYSELSKISKMGFSLQKTVNYFCKFFYIRCLRGFRIRLWTCQKLVLVIKYLGGQVGINCSNPFLKILKFQFSKIFKYDEDDLAQKSHERNMRLLVNHTKPTNTQYWN